MSSIVLPEAEHTAGEAGTRPDAQALIAEARAHAGGHRNRDRQLPACFGVPPLNGPLPVTPGTVMVLRGRISWKPTGPGTWQIVYPKGPVLAWGHISDNYTQKFRFALPPGQYVIAGSYDPGLVISTARQVTVAAGKISYVTMPSVCK